MVEPTIFPAAKADAAAAVVFIPAGTVLLSATSESSKAPE